MNNRASKVLTFKNNVPLRSCISKINSTFIDNAEDLFLEYSDNYSVISGRFLNFYREEINDDANESNAANFRVNNEKATTTQKAHNVARTFPNGRI